MRILYRKCAGLDVHKTSVVACVLTVQEDSRVEEQVRDDDRGPERVGGLAEQPGSRAGGDGVHGGLFCAEQRIDREGSSPSSARMRGAVSKRGDKTSLAGESGRYGET